MESEDHDTDLSPDDAFAVLSNETRIEILRALWEAYDPYERDNSVSFSELYDRVGFGDTGNFSYHLRKLTDHFVRQTDEGYELTESGFAIVRAVVAGTVGERPAIDSTEIDVDCPQCGAPVELDYENMVLTARCTRCAGLWEDYDGSDGLLFGFRLPPAGLADRTLEEAFHATNAYFFNKIRAFRGGVCPYCSGVVDESIDVCEEHEPGEDGRCPECNRQHMIEVWEVCGHCKEATRGPLSIAILTHPAVTAFYYEHGIEGRFASWESFQRGRSVTEELVGTDPLRIRVTVPCKGDRLRLTLDETLEVVDVER